MRRILAFAALLALLAVAQAPAQQVAPVDAPTVAQVAVSGNQFLRDDTLLFYVSTKPGDRYD
jgi:outer membrane protein assembly factor BamA